MANPKITIIVLSDDIAQKIDRPIEASSIGMEVNQALASYLQLDNVIVQDDTHSLDMNKFLPGLNELIARCRTDSGEVN